MGSIHQSKAQQSKKPNPSLLSLASVSPRAPGAEPPSVPPAAPTSRRRRPRTGSSRPGPSAPPPPSSGPPPVRRQGQPGRPLAATPPQQAATARRRGHQPSGGPAASGADEYCSCAPPSLHPRPFNSNKPATQQGKGKRNTLDPHPSTYQCSIQDFLRPV